MAVGSLQRPFLYPKEQTMKRIIAAIVLVAITATIGLNIGPTPDEARRIMATPEAQHELEYRRSL